MNKTRGTEKRQRSNALQANNGSSSKRFQLLAVALLFIGGWLMVAVQVFAVTPSGPVITYIDNETYAGYGVGTALDDSTYSGGDIITLNLNAIQTNENWKGFAGNITGGLALADTQGNQLYNWSATIRGQVYVSRSQTITWSGLVCANDTTHNMSADEDDLSHTGPNTDNTNITDTFGGGPGSHPAFTAADISFTANLCNYTIYTNINSNPETANWSEIILASGTDRIYTTLINDSQIGFDGSPYDYQIIVPENGTIAGKPHETTYYLFVELT